MKILLLGASGFIGSEVLARLLDDGHAVTAVARGHGRRAAGVQWLRVDIAAALEPGDWQQALDGAAAVINCAGALQDGPRDDLHGVHVHGINALYDACEARGVRRVVHVSAIGADRPAQSAFSATKGQAETALAARTLDWVILRPAVVVGRSAYGGSALLRGLSALPVLPRLPQTGRLQLVQLDDLVETIAFFIAEDAPARVAVDVASPEVFELDEVLLAFRRWLRLGEPRTLAVPPWLARLAYVAGDAAAVLGWRPPVRSTARLEFLRGAVGDPQPWLDLTGIRPLPFARALRREPASVQERWFARLYFLKPAAIVILAGYWIATGLISVGPGWESGLHYMRAAGLGAVAAPGVLAAALADIAIGAGIAFRRSARAALTVGLVLSGGYAITASLLLPQLWSDPLGPLLKIVPLMLLMLFTLAVLEGR